MKITLAYIGDAPKLRAYRELVLEYVTRANHYISTTERGFVSMSKFIAFVKNVKTTEAAYILFCDSQGELVSSKSFALLLEKYALGSIRHVIFAVGPANGWQENELKFSDGIISFGLITLPHELALVLLAEQLYRALTIRAGHPYHRKH